MVYVTHHTKKTNFENLRTSFTSPWLTKCKHILKVKSPKDFLSVNVHFPISEIKKSKGFCFSECTFPNFKVKSKVANKNFW